MEKTKKTTSKTPAKKTAAKKSDCSEKIRNSQNSKS